MGDEFVGTPSDAAIAEGLAKLRAATGIISSGGIPDGALRREHIYDDQY